jgi:hypothetical protein
LPVVGGVVLGEGVSLRRLQGIFAAVAFASLVALDARADEPPPPVRAPAEVGLAGGLPFFRAFDDQLRLYPGAAVRVDGSWADAPDDLAPELGADEAGARLALRRVRLELSGEVARRVAFTAAMELGGGRVGQTPYVGAATPRWVPVDAHDGVIRPEEVSVSYTPARWLNFTVGQQYLPFSLENRTREEATTYLEKNVAIRGFAVPDDKAVGATIWGELEERAFAYELGAFAGGFDRPLFDGSVDGVGRLFARPLAPLGESMTLDQLQIGASARIGVRDPEDYLDDYPTIASDRGYALWRPGFVDPTGRTTRVLPSGTQRAVGGELRVPALFADAIGLDLRGEAYFVQNDTREAIAGFEVTHTERLGVIEGVSWYANLDVWLDFIPGLGAFVTGEPGMARPPSLDDATLPALQSALELSLLGGGIHASYDAASRLDSSPADNQPAGDIDVFTFGAALQYWYGANLRAAFNYVLYYAPESGDPSVTQVVVPDNLTVPAGDGHLHQEIGLRLAATL